MSKFKEKRFVCAILCSEPGHFRFIGACLPTQFYIVLEELRYPNNLYLHFFSERRTMVFAYLIREPANICGNVP